MGLPILKNRWLGKCCLVCRSGLVYWCPVDTTAMKSIRCFYPLSSVCSSVNYVKSIIFFGNKKYSSMAQWKLSEPFVLMVTSILFIVYNTVKQHKLTKSALKTDTFTFHVFKKPSFQIHEKLKSVSYCVKTHPLFTWFLIDTKSISAVSRSAIDLISIDFSCDIDWGQTSWNKGSIMTCINGSVRLQCCKDKGKDSFIFATAMLWVLLYIVPCYAGVCVKIVLNIKR